MVAQILDGLSMILLMAVYTNSQRKSSVNIDLTSGDVVIEVRGQCHADSSKSAICLLDWLTSPFGDCEV